MMHSEPSVSIQTTGLTLFSGLFVLDRTHLSFSLSSIMISAVSLKWVSETPYPSFMSSFYVLCRRVRGGNGCKVGDDNGSLMLMWEDGYCRGGENGFDDGEDDPVRKAFSKMSIQLYNYGEGLMGKVASDKCHKWVFKEPSSESEQNISNYWQSSFDAIPTEWTDQFESGIQTIAVIQAGHGLLQLGSCKIIPEDLHFVLRMRHTFESLGYQSGFYLSQQLFSSTRNNNSSSSSSSILPSKQSLIPPPLFNYGQRPMPSTFASPNFQNPGGRMGGGFQQQAKEEPPHMFMHPNSEGMMGGGGVEQENDIKWPNGLSFFSALTGRTEDHAKLLFNPEDSLGNKVDNSNTANNNNSDASDMHSNSFLSLDSGSKMDDKYKRGFSTPNAATARMGSSSSSTSVDHHHHHQQQQQQAVEYRNSEARMYPDVMETFLE
ncbi:Protein RICE SALT SENSITIVE 3 [Linum perenne]